MMRHKFLLIVILFALSSCSTTVNVIQLFTVAFSNTELVKIDNLKYEDPIITIKFDFWGQKGNLSFQFFNKTNENLIVNLDSTFFILNDYAYPYFTNQTRLISLNEASASDLAKVSEKKGILLESFSYFKSQSSSFAIPEERQLVIPPKSYRYINTTMNILPEFIDLQDFVLEENTPKVLTKQESPINFRIRISYKNPSGFIFMYKDFEFYISEITKIVNDSENFNEFNQEFMSFRSPDKFYVINRIVVVNEY